MKLLVQPADGITPIIEGIEKAQKSIQVVIFRFDRKDLERVLEKAVARGVSVHALIAYLNRGGEKKLRKLELRLLEAGVTVARTSDDLVRYHDKFMIIDGSELYLMAFNFTFLDMEHSRSFAIVTKEPGLVKEASALFEADTKRKRYVAGRQDFVVSPVNARKQLESYLRGAKTELLIYDPKVSDRAMIHLLEERIAAGVKVRIIGRLTRHTEGVKVRRSPIRLHTRTIVRDRREVFIGSQSLCEAELDARREVGVITHEPRVVAGVVKVFEEDWDKATAAPDTELHDEATGKAAKKAVKAIAKELPPVAPILKQAVKKVMGDEIEIELDADEVEDAVRGAIAEAIQDAVQDAVQETVEQKEKELEKLKT